MRHWIRFASAAVLSCFAVFGAATPGSAQDYPNRVITMIVPLPAGGPTDQIARQIAPRMQEKLGQNVVIENVSGGATTIGTGRVARAAPDGYTLLMHSLQVSSNPGLYPKLPFDTEKELVPVIFINYNPIVLIGRKSLPPIDFAELVDWMRKYHAKFAIPGLGTTGHMTTVQLLNALGIDADIVPYRGAAPAMQDILGGHVDLYFAAPQSLVQAVEANSVKAYGVTQKDPSVLLPKVPSLVGLVGEQMNVRYWTALLAPAQTPKPILDKLNAVVREAMADKALLANWAEMGVVPFPPDQLSLEAGQSLFKSEIKRWGEVIRANKIEVPM